MSRIDWPGLMRAGLTELRLPPEVFWRLTPLELRMMLGADAASPLTRARLEELAAAFPDHKRTITHGDGAGTTGSDRGA